LQELREACGLSMYALWMKCGVSRVMISRIEGGESIPTLHVAARLAHAAVGFGSSGATCDRSLRQE